MKTHMTYFSVALAAVAMTFGGAQAAGADSQADAVLARLKDVCHNAASIQYKALIDVTIKTGNGHAVRDHYTVTGTFQHEVYARIDELQDGKAVLVVSSSLSHLYVYSPVTNKFRDFGNVPVDFALWDMMMAQGAQSDALAPASRYLGYYFDITGFFGSSYAGDSPWGDDHGIGKNDKQLADVVVDGKHVKRLTSIVRGSKTVTTWNILLDPTTGLPLRASMLAKGPSLTGEQGSDSIVTFNETYSLFKPAPQSTAVTAFEFTPPAGAAKVEVTD